MIFLKKNKEKRSMEKKYCQIFEKNLHINNNS